MKKNILLETLKRPFLKRAEDIPLSSTPKEEDVEHNLEDIISTGFFDGGGDNFYWSSVSKKQKTVQEQNKLIETYRRIAMTPEVSDAIDEIVDEAIFSPGYDDILEIVFSGDIPDTIKDKISNELREITIKINLDKNIYSMFRSFYIDGQLNVHCAYNPMDMGGGIQKFKVISPLNLQFNYSKDKWEYVDAFAGSDVYSQNQYNKDKVFDREEVIRVDSGIYSGNLILSNLHQAIKPANMLSTLEDMLIPMRFTRSISRRVFNVDVSKLNPKKAEEVMKKIQAKFKYQKFYNLEDGTISNQQHITSLTEDYWFPNRGGEKGTTVDTIDETGNLGEIEDILYFKRKLYTALKIPTDRINDGGNSGTTFDFTSDNISREELKFFNFVSRLRNQFLELFYELLKRNVIAKGIATEDEWEDLLRDMSIKFTTENKFFERMEREKLNESLSLFRDMEEMAGKYFSYEYIYKKVLKLNDEEITVMHEQIRKEKKDPLWARFYKTEDNEEKW